MGAPVPAADGQLHDGRFPSLVEPDMTEGLTGAAIDEARPEPHGRAFREALSLACEVVTGDPRPDAVLDHLHMGSARRRNRAVERQLAGWRHGRPRSRIEPVV